MPKRRTVDTTSVPVAADPPGTHYSNFRILINPLKVFPAREKSSGWWEMKKRLEGLGNFLLKKKTIASLLDFGKDWKGTLNGVTLPRAEHINLIDSYDENRVASLEYGSINKCLHLHLSVCIRHRTFLRINRERLERIISKFLNMPAKEDGKYPFHLKYSCGGRDSKDYVLKGMKQLSEVTPGKDAAQ